MEGLPPCPIQAPTLRPWQAAHRNTAAFNDTAGHVGGTTSCCAPSARGRDPYLAVLLSLYRKADPVCCGVMLSVGGMAVFPDMNVSFGRGPSAVEVICVAIGSYFPISNVSTLHGRLTKEDTWLKVLLYWRRILLQISSIVVERTLLSQTGQMKTIIDHLLVQPVQMLMLNGIFDNNQPIMVEASNRNLQVCPEGIHHDHPLYDRRVRPLWPRSRSLHPLLLVIHPPHRLRAHNSPPIRSRPSFASRKQLGAATSPYHAVWHRTPQPRRRVTAAI